nr:DUF2868 domain-containing protein [Pseudomarimonas arenosa]
MLSLIACEYQRLEERRGLRADDQALVARLRGLSSSPVSKILARSDALAAARWGAGWEARLIARLRWIGALVFVVVLLAGAGSASLVLGEGARPANVLWLVGSLLGLPSLMLLLWLLSLLWRPSEQRSGPRLPRWLAALALRWAGIANAEQLWTASAGLLRGNRLPRWGFSLLSHALWLAWLGGALLGLAFAFSLRRYDFVWETTLLAPQWLPQLIDRLAIWPAQLGFAVPDAAQVAASAVQPEGSAEVAQRWAEWSLGMLLGYGLLPRLLALLVSGGCLLWQRRRLALDLSLPYYLSLLERLSPSHQRLQPQHAVAPVLPRFQVARARAASAGEDERLVLCLECDPPALWMDNDLAIERVESREERALMLRRLRATPASRLLFVLDPRLSPDRSSLGFLSEISPHTAQLRIGLLQPACSERLQAWLEELQAIGVPAEHCLQDAEQARHWLEGDDDEH